MKQELNKHLDFEHCPNCDMPLEDVEVCSYCDWKRISEKKEVKENDRHFSSNLATN